MKKLTTFKIVLIAVTILLLSTQYSFAQWGSIGDRIADDLSKKAQQKIADSYKLPETIGYNFTF